MSRRRGERGLSAEERALWDLVRNTAAPLSPERARPEPPEPVEAEQAPAPKRPRANNTEVAQPARKPPPAALPGAIDRRTRTRLSRGGLEVERRLDLHGLTQAVAHLRLKRFLEDAQAEGNRLVLVITGKGSFGDSDRGVLRRSVPEWLRAPAFRSLVAGFDEAGRRHGGGGALYVNIRKRRREDA